MTLDRSEYTSECRKRWHGICLHDAKNNWFDFEDIRETLIESLRRYKSNPGMEDLCGVFHNPDYTLTSFLWKLQTALEPDRSYLRPLLDFEEHHQTVFLRRGLLIYCSMILRQLETPVGHPEPALL